MAISPWASKTHFVGQTPDVQRDLTQALRTSVRRAAEGKGKPPAVIIDLDGTLSDNRTRTLKILKLWLQTSEVPASAREKLEKVQLEGVEYGLKATLQCAGLTPAEVKQTLTRFRPFWDERFFSNEFIPFDTSYQGSQAWVRQLVEQGATVIYLTGRSDTLTPGTRRELLEEGFPLAAHTRLILQPDKVPDDVFKESVTHSLKDQFDIVATVDNEPANILAFVRGAPDALHVFVDTSHSDLVVRPGEEADCIYRMTWA